MAEPKNTPNLPESQQRYPGKNFRERERIKRKVQRWEKRLAAMPEVERQAMLALFMRDTKGQQAKDRQARIFHSLIYDLLDAIDEFGYEAVYFGVGCEVFPDAVNPWEGNDH